MKNWKSKTAYRPACLLPILASLALWGCVPGNPTAAIDPSAPRPIDPLPSPTPTWALPDPDDEDPITDCNVETPICLVGEEINVIKGETFLGLQFLVPVQAAYPSEQVETIRMDADITLLKDGKILKQIVLDGYTWVLAPSDPILMLSQKDGTPALSIASSDLGTQITILIPIESDLGGLCDLIGTISIYGETGKGKRVHYGESLVEMEGVRLVQEQDVESKTTPIPSATPAARMSSSPPTQQPSATTKAADVGGKPKPTAEK